MLRYILLGNRISDDQYGMLAKGTKREPIVSLIERLSNRYCNFEIKEVTVSPDVSIYTTYPMMPPEKI